MWRQPDVKHWGQPQRNRLELRYTVFQLTFPAIKLEKKRRISPNENEMADSRVEHSFPTAASCLKLKASSDTSIPPPYLVRASKAMFGAINKGSAFIEAFPDLLIFPQHRWLLLVRVG